MPYDCSVIIVLLLWWNISPIITQHFSEGAHGPRRHSTETTWPRSDINLSDLSQIRVRLGHGLSQSATSLSVRGVKIDDCSILLYWRLKVVIHDPCRWKCLGFSTWTANRLRGLCDLSKAMSSYAHPLQFSIPDGSVQYYWGWGLRYEYKGGEMLYKWSKANYKPQHKGGPHLFLSWLLCWCVWCNTGVTLVWWWACFGFATVIWALGKRSVCGSSEQRECESSGRGPRAGARPSPYEEQSPLRHTPHSCTARSHTHTHLHTQSHAHTHRQAANNRQKANNPQHSLIILCCTSWQ